MLLERRKGLRRRRNQLIITRPDSHVSHPCLADHSSPIWSRFRFWSGEKLPKKEETYKNTQVKSKYRYMGFGLWENTDPTAPKPIKKPSPPPPPPKVMQTWYFVSYYFSALNYKWRYWTQERWWWCWDQFKESRHLRSWGHNNYNNWPRNKNEQKMQRIQLKLFFYWVAFWLQAWC